MNLPSVLKLYPSLLPAATHMAYPTQYAAPFQRYPYAPQPAHPSPYATPTPFYATPTTYIQAPYQQQLPQLPLQQLQQQLPYAATYTPLSPAMSPPITPTTVYGQTAATVAYTPQQPSMYATQSPSMYTQMQSPYTMQTVQQPQQPYSVQSIQPQKYQTDASGRLLYSGQPPPPPTANSQQQQQQQPQQPQQASSVFASPVSGYPGQPPPPPTATAALSAAPKQLPAPVVMGYQGQPPPPPTQAATPSGYPDTQALTAPGEFASQMAPTINAQQQYQPQGQQPTYQSTYDASQGAQPAPVGYQGSASAPVGYGGAPPQQPYGDAATQAQNLPQAEGSQSDAGNQSIPEKLMAKVLGDSNLQAQAQKFLMEQGAKTFGGSPF